MSETVVYLQELLQALGYIEARRMFGGYGIFLDGLMFGIVAEEVFYLKADAQSKDAFEERGLRPFEYAKRGKTVRMSYYEAPEEIFEDGDAALHWGELACAAAQRASSGKPRKRDGRL